MNGDDICKILMDSYTEVIISLKFQSNYCILLRMGSSLFRDESNAIDEIYSEDDIISH